MSRNLHQEITARIVAQLRAGVVPWRQPWSGQSFGAMPRNAITKRAYSGVNVLLLWATAQERGYTQPLWLTFNQAREAGGMVRKGEKSTQVIFVPTILREEEGEERRIPFLKSFNVFNVAQIDGLAIDGAAPVKARHNDERDEDAEAFMAATGAVIRHGEGRAYFRPSSDSIMLPNFETFSTAGAYYATAFHELGHWTGAENRLNRQFGKKFGDRAYSAEELVAELTSAFVCAEFGFDNDGQDAAYIDHWIKFLEDFDGAIVTAAAAASKAVEYMRGLALADEAPAAVELIAAPAPKAKKLTPAQAASRLAQLPGVKVANTREILAWHAAQPLRGRRKDFRPEMPAAGLFGDEFKQQELFA